jgi:hypothetical protein
MKEGSANFFSYNSENYLSYIPLAEDLQMLQFQLFYRMKLILLTPTEFLSYQAGW